MSNYPSDMNQNDFDRAHDELGNPEDFEFKEEPNSPYFLLECGHIEIIQFYQGEQFCQKCLDEFDALLDELIAKKKRELASPGRADAREHLEDVNNLKPENFTDYEKFKKDWPV